MTDRGDSTDALRSLYQEVILDHYRRPRNRGDLPEADATIHMNNPVCGDEITLSLRTDSDHVEEIRFSGQGCSISQASASIMTELVRGHDRSEIAALYEHFKKMVRGTEGRPDRSLGDARALAGVARFPVRVRCALLAWNALEEALGTSDPAG